MQGFSVNFPQIAGSSKLQLRPRHNCCAADTFPVPGGPGGNGLPAIQSVLSGSPAEQLKARGVLATSSHTAAALLPLLPATTTCSILLTSDMDKFDSESKSNISLQQSIM